MEGQKETLYWLWMRLIPGIGPVAQRRLVQHFESPVRIYEADWIELEKVSGIGPTLARKVLDSRELSKAERQLETMEKKGIHLLTIMDEGYSERLKEDPLAPSLLFYRGNLKPNMSGIGIVGSRKCSEYGKLVTVEAAQYLARKGVAVVSGMAKGIDSYAHTACLQAGGRTLAFLGCGVDICYPMEHGSLMDGIISNGAVLSEYLPGTRPMAEHFPRRNALISGWSEKLLVAEAAEKSGALITARIAKSHGKEVLVPPHDLTRTTGKGTNLLLKEGATLYLTPDQLWACTGHQAEEEQNEAIPLEEWLGDSMKEMAESKEKDQEKTKEEQIVLDVLDNEALTIDTLQQKTGIQQLELLGLLAEMELKGLVKTVPGGRFKK